MPPRRRKPVVEVTRPNVREIPPAFYEHLAIRPSQMPLRLRESNPRAVAVGYRLAVTKGAKGDIRPGRARPDDAAWSRVLIDPDGMISVE